MTAVTAAAPPAVFVDVPCPNCGEGKVFQIATGLSRGKCPTCKRIVTAGRTPEGVMHVLRVDKSPSRHLGF